MAARRVGVWATRLGQAVAAATVGAGVVAGSGATTTCAEHDEAAAAAVITADDLFQQAGPLDRASIFGAYENRLRKFSNPEKVRNDIAAAVRLSAAVDDAPATAGPCLEVQVFEYFSSVEDRKTGERFMTTADFVRASIPWSPYVSTGLVGSSNPKFQYTARRLVPSSKVAAEYQARVHRVLSHAEAILSSHSQEASAAARAPPALACRLPTRRSRKLAGVISAMVQRSAAGTAPAPEASALEQLRALVAEAQTLETAQAGGEAPADLSSLVTSLRPHHWHLTEWVALLTALELGSGVAASAAGDELAELVDEDGDSLVDFGSFVVLTALLSVPARQLTTAFHAVDTDNSGAIDKAELTNLMAMLLNSTPHGQQVRDVDQLGRQQGRVAASVPKLGDDGDGLVTQQEFLSFAHRLRRAVWSRWFHQLDADGTGGLSRAEFARMLLLYVPADQEPAMRQRALSYARRLEAEGTLAKDEVTITDLMSFLQLLERIDEMEWALEATAAAEALGAEAADADVTQASRAEIAAACSASQQVGVTAQGLVMAAERALVADERGSDGSSGSLSPAVADVITALFDADGDGHVSIKELVGTLRRGRSLGLDDERTYWLIAAARRVIPCAVSVLAGSDR